MEEQAEKPPCWRKVEQIREEIERVTQNKLREKVLRRQRQRGIRGRKEGEDKGALLNLSIHSNFERKKRRI